MTLLVRHERMEEDFGLGLPRKWKATGAKLFVAVQTLSGSELVVANQLESRASHVLTAHYTNQLRTGDRLVGEYTNQIFNIVAIDNVMGMNRELRLTVTEVVAP